METSQPRVSGRVKVCTSELGKTITYYNPYLFCAYVASQIREVQAGNALDPPHFGPQRTQLRFEVGLH